MIRRQVKDPNETHQIIHDQQKLDEFVYDKYVNIRPKCAIPNCNNDVAMSKFKYCGIHSSKDYCRYEKCIHDKTKSVCRLCNPLGYLLNNVRSRIYSAMKHMKSKRSLEYLGCDIQTYRNHLENQFKDGMSWSNYGLWHIDHIIPLKYSMCKMIKLTPEVIEQRLHYTNTQPLWASENIRKSNRYIG